MDRLTRATQEVLDLVSVDLYAAAGVASRGRLLVSAFREGAHHVYVLERGGLIRLTRAPIAGLARVPYGSRRALAWRDVARGRELHRLYWLDADGAGEEDAVPGMEPARVMGAAFEGDTIVYSAATREGLAVYSVEGGEARLEARPEGFIPAVVALRSGVAAGVAFTGALGVTLKPFTLKLGTGELRVHEPPVDGNVTALDLDSRGRLVYAVEAEGGARVYRLDPETGEQWEEELAGDLAGYRPLSIHYIHEAPGGLLVAARRGWRGALFQGGRRLPSPDYGVPGAAFEWGGGVAFTHTSLHTPTRVLHASGGGWRVVLEGRAPWWLGEALGGAGEVEVESEDGERVPVVYLESRRAPRPGPTVVYIHGGPFAEDADVWDPIAAALAAAGFHVVMPNYRGSTGRGPRWMRLVAGDPCGGELGDVAAAAGWARRAGLASRLYVMGYSYGGYLTLCALTRRPGLFAAGVAGAPVADWGEMYELSDPAFKAFIEIITGGRDPGKWRERSPTTYAAELREPLCIIQPQNDSRTPLKPVLRFIERASEAGKSVEAHIAPDMGHAVNTREDAVKILLPAVQFLLRVEERATRQP